MKFLILGAGGIGSYYGTKLLKAGHSVIFVARGRHLDAIQHNGLKLQHPEFHFHENVTALTLNEIKTIRPPFFDAVLITTKSTSTYELAKELSSVFPDAMSLPYLISLQNGVENEDILCEFFPKEKVIGALTRKIGAHIIEPGSVEVTGVVETIVGVLEPTTNNEIFLQYFSKLMNNANIYCEISNNIKKELWKKLVINNGVNALCALLQIKTGVLMNDKKLNRIVYGLMKETAIAASACGVNITQNDVKDMYNLIQKFDSIKPSMLVDREFKRPLEIDEICGVVIKYCEQQDIDASYTRTISTLLGFIYSNEKV